MKKVVYTCIIGGYDKIPKYKYIDNSWDYVLFTDNKDWINRGKIYHWEIRKNPYDKLDNTKNSRYVKINPHIVFPDYDVSVYFDANISVRHKKMMDRFDALIKENCLVAIPLHPQRNCLYEEAKIIKALNIDVPEVVDAQIEIFKQQKFPEQMGLFENNTIYRKHNDENLIKVQKLWWSIIEKYSKRDQLSGVYSFWKNNVNIKKLFPVAGYHKKCKEIKFIKNKSHNRFIKKTKSEKKFNFFQFLKRFV